MSDFPSDIRYLELLEISEPEVNMLRLVVAEAIVRDEAQEVLLGVKFKARPVTVGEDSRVFEFVWSNYVAYTITNETFALPDEKSVLLELVGMFRHYSASRYLEFVQASTYAATSYPGLENMSHWELCCGWHIVDVVSGFPPKIAQLTRYELPKVDLNQSKH